MQIRVQLITLVPSPNYVYSQLHLLPTTSTSNYIYFQLRLLPTTSTPNYIYSQLRLLPTTSTPNYVYSQLRLLPCLRSTTIRTVHIILQVQESPFMFQGHRSRIIECRLAARSSIPLRIRYLWYISCIQVRWCII